MCAYVLKRSRSRSLGRTCAACYPSIATYSVQLQVLDIGLGPCVDVSYVLASYVLHVRCLDTYHSHMSSCNPLVILAIVYCIILHFVVYQQYIVTVQKSLWDLHIGTHKLGVNGVHNYVCI